MRRGLFWRGVTWRGVVQMASWLCGCVVVWLCGWWDMLVVRGMLCVLCVLCMCGWWLVACGSGVWVDRLWFAFRDPVTVKKQDMTVV